MAYDATNNLSTLDDTLPVGSVEPASNLDDAERETRRTFKAVLRKEHNDDGSHKSGFLTTAMIPTGGVSTSKLADDSVTAAKINADVAGNGLTQNATTGALEAYVDNVTLEIVADKLTVKNPVGAIADNSIAASKLVNGNPAEILVAGTTGAFAAVAMTGVIAISDAGVTSYNSVPNAKAVVLTEILTVRNFPATTWSHRLLVSESDPRGICVLSAYGFTLQTGTYLVMAKAPAFNVRTHQIRLYNDTDAATELWGSCEYAGLDVQNSSMIFGTLVVTSNTDVYYLDHIGEVARLNDGFGIMNGFAGPTIQNGASITLVKIID